MRIAILTLPLHTNYGGIVQAYALQTLLERMGHEVRVINKRTSHTYKLPLWKLPLVYGKRILMKICVDRHTVINREAQMRRELPIVRQHTNAFIDKYIRSFYIEAVTDIKRDDFDAFVVGSDQIWRPQYIRGTLWGDYGMVFLGFTKGWDVRRYAYAASFGVDVWEFPKEETPVCAALCQSFQAISVREDTGVDLCKKYLHVDAVHLLDPTMVLRAEDYLALTEAANTPRSAGDMFCYILDKTPAKQGLIDRVARERRLKPFDVREKTLKETHVLAERIIPSVETWLRAFADAKLILTDSFHGCAFSLLFGKPFVAIGNVGRGLSRMQSLLRMFGLEDHLLLDVSDYDPRNSYAQPPRVRDLLEKQRRRSLAFLEGIKS